MRSGVDKMRNWLDNMISGVDHMGSKIRYNVKV